ncbi:MAG TPA: hypothetical protein VL088_14985 [Pedobacter sp.]|nr:hypothetical protein [Pedobacter sp.]
MKLKILVASMIVIISFAIIFICRNDDKIETIAIVTPINYSTDIFIFFEQDTLIGNVKKANGEHLFYAESDPSVFFVKEKIGKGYIVNYQLVNGKLEKVDYVSPMAVKNALAKSYQVIGGAYRWIHTPYYKNDKNELRFITFKAGTAGEIKDDFMFSDSVVIAKYKIGLGIK